MYLAGRLLKYGIILIYIFGFSHSGLSQFVTLKYKAFTSVFDTVHHIPFYSYYKLTNTQANNLKKYKRLKSFSKDPNFTSNLQANNSIFLKSGYDKGHLTPAEDMSFDSIAEAQCFYFTNIIPQNPKLNRGQWKALEDHIRNEALATDSILIITGGFSFNSGKVLKNIYIPDSIFKIIYDYKTDISEFFIVPNSEIVDYKTYSNSEFIISNVDFKKIIKKIRTNAN